MESALLGMFVSQCLLPAAWPILGSVTVLLLPCPCQELVCTHQLAVLTQKVSHAMAKREGGQSCHPQAG